MREVRCEWVGCSNYRYHHTIYCSEHLSMYIKKWREENDRRWDALEKRRHL